jgi:hypothetical protein
MSHVEQLIFPVRGSQFVPQRGLIKRLTPATGETSGSLVELRREPTNKRDPNAVGIWSSAYIYDGGVPKLRRFRTGYVPKELAQQVAQLIDSQLLVSKEIHQLLSTRNGWRISVCLSYTARRTEEIAEIKDPAMRAVLDAMAVPDIRVAKTIVETAGDDPFTTRHLIDSYNEECFAEPGA